MDILKEGPKENNDVIQMNVSLPLQVLQQVILGDTFASEGERQGLLEPLS